MNNTKFRAWSVKDKKMYYAEYGEGFFETNGSWWAISKDDVERAGSVCNDVLMQFTGLLDKSGTEIYEGDVVKATNTENVGEIKYISEHSAFVVYSKDENGAYYEYMNQGLTQQYFEVIGNIHDNPELLEVE